MNETKTLKSSFARILALLLLFALVGVVFYLVWTPGMDVQDGRHDLKRNGIWISHGWLGGDDWFVRNKKTNELARYRDEKHIQELSVRLRDHHITDVFPHLCPASVDGLLPSVNAAQVESFLDGFAGFRVIPWIGGPNGAQARYADPEWRNTFVNSINGLLSVHPRLAGVHLNIEPMTSGDPEFVKLLGQIRAALPPGKILSVAAYPPPTRWQPSLDVHWSEDYFKEVSQHCDQMVVMMYDTAIQFPKFYQKLMADWTVEVLSWSKSRSVLLGLPTYDDAGVDYHLNQVENLQNALLGVHRGLGDQPLPAVYQGTALYCEWQTDEAEWQYFDDHFLKQ